MTTPDIDLDAIEAAALDATPGPWKVGACFFPENYVVSHDGEKKISASERISYSRSEGTATQRKKNNFYIAAANPAAVLELIRRLRAAEGATN